MKRSITLPFRAILIKNLFKTNNYVLQKHETQQSIEPSSGSFQNKKYHLKEPPTVPKGNTLD